MNPKSDRPLPLPGNLDDLLDALGQGGSGVLSMSEIKTLAVHTWRLGQRIERLDDSNARVKRQLGDSHRTLLQMLDAAGIEVVDPVGQPFRDGWTEVEVLSTETPDTAPPAGVQGKWVLQTMRPILRHNSKLLAAGEVIVADISLTSQTDDSE